MDPVSDGPSPTEPVVSTLTAGDIMQDALDILYNPASLPSDTERAKGMITAAREIRIASGKHTRTYAQLVWEELPAPVAVTETAGAAASASAQPGPGSLGGATQ